MLDPPRAALLRRAQKKLNASPTTSGRPRFRRFYDFRVCSRPMPRVTVTFARRVRVHCPLSPRWLPRLAGAMGLKTRFLYGSLTCNGAALGLLWPVATCLGPSGRSFCVCPVFCVRVFSDARPWVCTSARPSLCRVGCKCASNCGSDAGGVALLAAGALVSWLLGLPVLGASAPRSLLCACPGRAGLKFDVPGLPATVSRGLSACVWGNMMIWCPAACAIPFALIVASIVHIGRSSYARLTIRKLEIAQKWRRSPSGGCLC